VRLEGETSETEAGLHLDGSGTQSVLGFAEMRVVQVVLDVPEVQLVEQAEEVGAELEFRVLAQHLHVRETKRIAQRCVNVEIARPSERVASETWSARDRSRWGAPPMTAKRRSGREGRVCKISGPTIGEVSAPVFLNLSVL
jgi:hypothetical protein